MEAAIMVSRFESLTELKNFSLLLNELRDKQKNLNKELNELQKDKNNRDHDHLKKIRGTKQKYEAITKILDEIDQRIEDFNIAPKEKNVSETDKTAEFWFITRLASRVVHHMVENLHILVGYRNIAKPAAGLVPGLLAAVGIGAFFAAPILSATAAIAALMCGLRMTASIGFSKTTGYIGLPNSFGQVAKLVDELVGVALEIKPHASLPDTLTTDDIANMYALLGLEKGASNEDITKRMEELTNQYRQEITVLNSSQRAPTPNDDYLRTEIAQKTVSVMMAGVTASVYAMKNPNMTHKVQV